MALLELQDIRLNFGGLCAINGISFQIQQGELFSLIGPNGAGKTSVINCICAFYRPNQGKIVFDGRVISGLRPNEVTASGIARTFQNLESFKGMTVLDNIKLGAHVHLKTGPISGMLMTPAARREERELQEFLEREILERLGLSEVKDRVVRTLPYGQQKRVDFGRALASRPKMLVMDEPVAGMNAEETQAMVSCIRHFKKAWDLTILLVEHDMEVVMSISDRVGVINFGEWVAEGTPEEIQRNPQVIDIYLGAEAV